MTNPTLGSGLRPTGLHSAYALPNTTSVSATQTIAIVDAYNDPAAAADLATYDAQVGLPECTTANGCFRRVNQNGKASPLPSTNGNWAQEISLDVQMAHAICNDCHIILIEANSSNFSDLESAVQRAVTMGATEISNSYGGPEEPSVLGDTAYQRPGIVVTASSGDHGYLDWTEGGSAPLFPASSPDVVAVGGTALTHTGGAWTSTAWSETGGGCSSFFNAPSWQTATSTWAATGCGSNRLSADVSAVGDPATGVAVYDSTPDGEGDPTGWTVFGGTSVSSPIVASEFALAGGAQGASQPAATLYAHLGDNSALYDVTSGSNGSCSGATACAAAPGLDGPTGVGSPIGLGAFSVAAIPAPANTVPPTISGVTTDGHPLSAAAGTWTNSPSSFTYQWEVCDNGGASCVNIGNASAATYSLQSTDVDHTIRVTVTGINGGGRSAATSSATSTVVAAAPAVTSLPMITGVTSYGNTLTADPGTWTGTAVVAYAYQWQRCDGSGANCSNIGGAVASTYIVTSSDAGSTIRVVVTATNAAGSAAATSAATSAATAVVATPTLTPTLTVVNTAPVGTGSPANPATNAGGSTDATALATTVLTQGPPPWSGTIRLASLFASVSSGKASVKLRCQGHVCHGVLTLRNHSGRKAVIYGSVAYSFKRSAHAVAKVDLTKAGGALLTRHRSATVWMVITVSGHGATTARVVLYR